MSLKRLLLSAFALVLSLPQSTDPLAVNRQPVTPRPLPVVSNKLLVHQPEKAPDIDKLKQSDWYATAMKNMQEAEYYFKK